MQPNTPSKVAPSLPSEYIQWGDREVPFMREFRNHLNISHHSIGTTEDLPWLHYIQQERAMKGPLPV
jgi:hypothetical protein